MVGSPTFVLTLVVLCTQALLLGWWDTPPACGRFTHLCSYFVVLCTQALLLGWWDTPPACGRFTHLCSYFVVLCTQALLLGWWDTPHACGRFTHLCSYFGSTVYTSLVIRLVGSSTCVWSVHPPLLLLCVFSVIYTKLQHFIYYICIMYSCI